MRDKRSIKNFFRFPVYQTLHLILCENFLDHEIDMFEISISCVQYLPLLRPHSQLLFLELQQQKGCMFRKSIFKIEFGAVH